MTQGSTTWKWPLAATTSEGVVDEPSDKEGQPLSPTNTLKGGVTTLDVTWPSGVPIVGGGELKFWSPLLPVNVFVNPFGLVQLTLSLALWGYRNDQGDESPHGWGRYPHSTVAKQWEKKVKTMKQLADKTNSLVSKPGAIQQIDLFKSFSVDMNLQLLALAQWAADKGLFQGDVAGQFLAAVNFTITPSLSVGVGIRGIASISVKGMITLTLFFGVPMGTQPAGLPNAHFAAGWSARI